MEELEEQGEGLELELEELEEQGEELEMRLSWQLGLELEMELERRLSSGSRDMGEQLGMYSSSCSMEKGEEVEVRDSSGPRSGQRGSRGRSSDRVRSQRP